MYTVREVLERGYTGRELRYALLSGAHYSKNLNFTWQGMDDAKTALARIDEWRKRLADVIAAPPLNPQPHLNIETLENALDEGAVNNTLSHDLNVNSLLGLLFVTIRMSHSAADAEALSRELAFKLESRWKKVNEVLGLGDPSASVPAEVQALADQRAAARKAKDFAQSDALRKQIEALGWKVKDTAKGQELSPA
jgi:cysteinyl-tRNA synthetase